MMSAAGKGLLAPSLTRGIVWLDRALALAQACPPHLREHIVVSFALLSEILKARSLQ